MIAMPVDYASPSVPEGYVCEKCGDSGVRLWRRYQTFLEGQDLLCFDCTVAEQGKDSMTENMSAIGWRVAAIPTKDGVSFWGYLSVPADGCEWWYRLSLNNKGDG